MQLDVSLLRQSVRVGDEIPDLLQVVQSTRDEILQGVELPEPEAFANDVDRGRVSPCSVAAFGPGRDPKTVGGTNLEL